MADPNWADRALLLPFDTDLTDFSDNAFTVAASGGAAVSSADSKYGPASLSLTAEGDYLTLPNNAEFSFPGDFTIECWLKVASIAGGQYRPIFNLNDNNAAGGFLFFTSNGFLRFVESGTTVAESFDISADTWHHVAAVRSGTTLTLYVDGVNVASGTTSTSFVSGSQNYIGAEYFDAVTYSSGVDTFIDDYRISQRAEYTSNFTPPTTAHPIDSAPQVFSAFPTPMLPIENTVSVLNIPDVYASIPSIAGEPSAYATYLERDPFIDDVVILVPMTGSNGSTTFEDKSLTPYPINVLGDASIDTAEFKWDGGSASFDGAGDGLSVGDNGSRSVLAISGDYAIEAWFYFDAFSAIQYLFDYGAENGGSFNLIAYVDTFRRIIVGSYITTSTNIVDPATWHHIAITRSSGTTRLFVDGVQVGSSGFGINPRNIGNTPYIGIKYDNTFPLDGRVQDFRLTIGQARYTSGFTVPLNAFEIPEPPVVFDIRSQFESPIQAPESVVSITPAARVSIPSPTTAPYITGYNNNSALLGSGGRYILRVTGDPVLEIPISSWQATVQSGRQSFLQAVVPGFTPYADALSARQGVSDIVVYRVTEYDGLTVEVELARAALTTIRVDSGAFRSTATLSGYTDAFSTLPTRPVAQLTGVRSTSQTVGGGVRVRADIDWQLRPSQTAEADGLSFIVDYINYYVTSAGQAYMDAGSRG